MPGVRVPPCKNVGSSGADSGVRRSRIYRGCAVQRLWGDAAVGKRGHEGRWVFTACPPRRSVPPLRLSPPLFSHDGRDGVRQGRVFTTTTARAREELMYTTTTPVRRAVRDGGREEKRGTSRFSHHSLLDPRVPESAPECDLRPIREATPLTWPTMARRGVFGVP